MASLTRQEIIQLIRNNESVILHGVVYSAKNLNELPSEAELAIATNQDTEKIKEDMEAQLAKLQADIAKLNAVNTAQKNSVGRPKTEKAEVK